MAKDDLECPYCEAELEVCNDDGFGLEEGRQHEMECYECGKKFVFETFISFYYEPSKADCLNGSPHDLVVREYRTHTYTRCKDCDYTKHDWKPVENIDTSAKPA